MYFIDSLKFILISMVIICLFHFNSGNVLSGEPGKLCPDPNLEYNTWSGEQYWRRFVTGNVSEGVQGDKFLCAKFTFQYEHDQETGNVLISLKSLNNQNEKQPGLIEGIRYVFEQNVSLLATKNNVVLSAVYEDFSWRYAPRVEIVTGLKFETAEEWFDWWEKSKGKLVLSDDGEQIVVRGQ